MNATKTIIDLYREQVSLNQDTTAVVFEQETISYKALDLKSTLWAKKLIDLGVEEGDSIGLKMTRSIDMIVAILAVLKAGGFYTPVNIDQPVLRTIHMLKESRSKFIITNTSNASELLNDEIFINTNDLEKSLNDKENKINLPKISPESLAYCIFTSGSTGKPKGVLMRHGSVVNLVKGLEDRVYKSYSNETLNIALLASYVFDASIQQIFGSLLQGHTLCIANDETRKDGAKLLSFYNKNNIDVSDGTPTHLRLLVNALDKESRLDKLSSWILAGEVLPKDLVKSFYSSLGEKTQLYNFYGPTETCVDSTCFKVDFKNLDSYNTIPIGKPLPNERVYVTDSYGSILPVGIVGELCIAGDGLAYGYVGDESLTLEKFTSEWIASEDRVYRTGDMVRWLPDGNLEYHGRKDEQVKIRGYRIELAEIEQQFNTHPKIEHAIVVSKKLEDDIQLIAYYKSINELSTSELKEHLAIQLPEYMIPHYYVHMEEFALNTNGKIDKKALPEYKLNKAEEYIAPSNDTEEKLVEIYSDILKLDSNSIGGNSNFFELGGNSLNFIYLKNRFKELFNTSLSLTELMSVKDIQELAQIIDAGVKQEFSKIPKAKELDYYPLSSTQERMYFLYECDKQSVVYNIPLVVTLRGVLNKEKLEVAFQKLIQRHESLRTIFEFIDEKPCQRILEEVDFSITYLNIDTDINETINNFIKPFDLNQSPLLRVGIASISKDEYLMIIDTHHIISDGITSTILLEDIKSLYKEEALPNPNIQYKDYVMWQLEEPQQKEIVKHKAFWLKTFSGNLPTLELPYSYNRPKERCYEGGNYVMELNKHEFKQLKKLSSSQGVTMFSLILSIYNVLLSKLTNQNDIVIGTAVAGRQHVDLESIAGVFINTLALRNYPFGEITFKSFLQQVQENTSLAFDHQLYPYEELVNALNLVRDTSRNALFDVFFNYEFEDQRVDLNDSDIRINSFRKLYSVSKFDLQLTALDSEENLDLIFTYSKGLFEASMIERFASYFKSIISAIIENVDFNLSELDVIPVSEQKVIIEDYNATRLSYERDESLVTLFQQQVQLYPDLVAVSYKGDSLTYSDLNEKSNQVAHCLVSKGVLPGNNVGLLFERSIDMVVGIFGVLKAGAAYLPLDPNLPEQRIGYMLDHSRSTFLLTTNAYLEQFTAYLPVLSIDSLEIRNQETTNLDIDLEADDIAYCIFTSGSSGKPKGVMMNHRSVTNLVKGLEQRVYHEYENKKIRVALLASFSFDASIQQIFGCLLQGHALYIVDEDSRKDGSKLRSFYNTNAIDLSDGTPTHLRLFVNALDEGASLDCLSSWILAGEILSKELVEKFYDLVGDKVQLYNFYGPTETCVDSTSYKVDLNTLKDYDSIPIGKPLPNERVYITDSYGGLLPLGVIGELCIAGDGLAQRYVGNASLTSEKFDSDWIPWEERVYRTGDLVRWLPDGNLTYHGRIDNQVKIRGHRIELSEIMHQLNAKPEINNSIVIIRENEGEKYLIAYYEASVEQNVTDMRLHLEGLLPSYMIPSHYVHMEKLPLTINGKVDRSLLLDFELKQEDNYIAPSTETEHKLVDVWSQVLKVDKEVIGVRTDFFDLGGHSLNLSFLANKLTKTFEVSISLTELFRLTTIKEQARVIDFSDQQMYSKIPLVEHREYYPLSSSQKRLYFLNEFDEDTKAYNQPKSFILKGALDKDKLTKVFQKIIDRHESLRTSFELLDGEPIQRIAEKVSFEIECFSSTLEESPEVISNFIRPFNLKKAPLFRVGLIHISKEKYIIIVDMHHIISDGVSIGIFINDLMALYQGKELFPLQLSYKDYAVWQQSKEQQKRLKSHKQFWNNQFAELPSILELPTDHVRPKVISYRGNTVEFAMNAKETKELNALAKASGSTLFSVVLGVYKVLLYKLTGQKDLIVGTSIAGRTHSDIEGVMGVFLNALPLRNTVKKEDSFLDFLSQINTHSLSSFEHQNYPYEELISDLSIARDTGRNPLFDVMFEYANFEQPEMVFSDLELLPYDYDYNISKFDLTLHANETDDGMYMDFQYATDLFNQETIENFVKYFKRIVNQVILNSDIKLNDIQLLSSDEFKTIENFSVSELSFEVSDDIVSLFENRVSEHPSRIAIEFQGSSLSYKELNERSNQVAAYLTAQKIKKGDIVGLVFNRSLDIIISILGVLKSGAAYAPIDPKLPLERARYILQSSKAKLLLGHKEYLGSYSAILKVHDIETTIEDVYSKENLDIERSPSDLAYCIYTSGSTGVPKGVLMEHRSIVNLVGGLSRTVYSGLGSGLKVGLLASYSFDASCQQIYGALLEGHSLFISSEEERMDGLDLYNFYKDNAIAISDGTPTHFGMLLSSFSGAIDLPHLKRWILAGESLPKGLVKDFYNRLESDNAVKLYNMYGPTESCVDSTYHCIDPLQLDKYMSIPIGFPLPNERVYIVDDSGKSVPVGVVGELCIAGAGLARGYVNKDNEKERFVTNWISGEERVYRTGDLARWLPDGNIEYKDRMDNQIKLRGYRIELGEIEHALLSYSKIVESAVLLTKIDDESYLSAYYVCEEVLDSEMLREHLLQTLPEYMVPSFYTRLDHMPLTVNGKLNKEALPSPNKLELENYIAPSTETEHKLVDIWSEILKVDKELVGVSNSFIDMGGHSLKMMFLVNIITKQFGVNVSLKEIMLNPTIRQLSELIQTKVWLEKDIDQKDLRKEIVL